MSGMQIKLAWVLAISSSVLSVLSGCSCNDAHLKYTVLPDGSIVDGSSDAGSMDGGTKDGASEDGGTDASMDASMDASVMCESNSCDVNATCDDATGSIVCTCDNGYSGDGTSCVLQLTGAHTFNTDTGLLDGAAVPAKYHGFRYSVACE